MNERTDELIELIKLEANQLYKPPQEYGLTYCKERTGSINDMTNRIDVLRKDLLRLRDNINGGI